MHKGFLNFFLVFLPVFLLAQEYNYVQYDTKDGLAGSTVYDVCQDKDGFMWFATDNGLTRYDGTNFKNFTVSDGLPDNETLKLLADSKGRVWISTFSSSICYYFKGNIYNVKNTAWLRNIRLAGAVLNFCEDEKGNLLMSDRKNLYQVTKVNQVINETEKPFLKKYSGKKVTALNNPLGPGFLVGIEDTAFKLYDDHLEKLDLPGDSFDKSVVTRIVDSKNLIIRRIPAGKISYTVNRNVTLFVSTFDGAWSIDTVKNDLSYHFLPGKKVSHVFKDFEGNLWFTTLGEGVFKLASLNVRNIDITGNFPGNDNEVYSITKLQKGLLCGLGFSRAAIIEGSRLRQFLNYSGFLQISQNNSSRNKLYASYAISDGSYLLGFDAFFVKHGLGKPIIKSLIAIKSIAKIDSASVLVGTYNYAFVLQLNNLDIVDTVFDGRTTKVLYHDHKFFIGTLNGLYVVDQITKQKWYAGKDNYSLSRRINDIEVDNSGIVWVATNDEGIVGLKNSAVVFLKKDADGISSNICKCLFVNHNFLYVGSNKGITKINLNDWQERYIKYDISSGMPSNIINDICVVDSIIYVASPKGLTYFDEKSISDQSKCKLLVNDVVVSGKKYSGQESLQLPYGENNITFNFIVVSFKSGGDISYHYRLKGLDNSWTVTNQTSLAYPTLPSGEYKFEIFAVNKFGVKSNKYVVAFSVDTPFYKTWWFTLLALFAFIMLVLGYFYWRGKKAEQRFRIENNLQKLFASLEQQALQAQMNPHFIFNCLNSIQQFVLTDEKEKANIYLSVFASLIRQTLYLSSKKSVTVEEEARYLTNYLEMEKMRYGDNFQYSVEGYQNPGIAFLELPALFLQPFVENSLRHGIRNKAIDNGIISIAFYIRNEMLTIEILDNGIGRAKAATYKSDLSVEYQSRGISLAEKRIDLLNKVNEKNIRLDIVDLVNELGEGVGTKVVIEISI